MLEKLAGDEFTISHDSVGDLRERAFKQLRDDPLAGRLSLVASAFYGGFGVADYSGTKWLWNDKLGLGQEDLDGFLRLHLARE